MFRFLLLFLILGNFLYAQNFNIIKDKFNNFSDTNNFDFVYLQTDKDVYKTGQNIWFSAYIYDAKKNQLDTTHQILFIELIDFQKNIIALQKLFVDRNGIANGNIFLPDSFSRGYYQIRAFTNSMKNYGSEHFFTKTIFIKSDKLKYSNIFYKEAKSKLRKKNSFIFNYKIIGDKLLNNVPSQIYFSSFNFYNNTLSKDFILTDNKEITYLSKNSKNTGNFVFTPEKKLKYLLKIKSKKRQKKIKLPQVEEFGTNVFISENQTDYLLKIFRKNIKSNDKISKSYYLLIEKNGKIITDSVVIVDSLLTVNIPKNILPQGISFLHIFNSDYQPIFEIPLYNKQNQTNLTFTSFYKNDTLTIKIINPKHMSGFFSLSITNCKSTFSNIGNYFSVYSLMNYPAKKTDSLVNSKNFNDIVNIYSHNIYDFDKILNQKQYYTHKIQKNNYLTGFVNFILEKVPAKNANLTINILNSYNDTYKTQTDKNGRFKFDSLNYEDSVEYFIEVTNQRNFKYLGITIDEYDTNKIFFEPLLFFDASDISYKHVYRVKHKEYESRSIYHLHPDQIISGEELANSGQTNVLEALKGRVANYSKTGDLVMMRGPSSIHSNLSPVYLIDDIPVDQDAVENLNIYDIDRVEIMRSAYGSAMYGINGANGVIAIYTKHGYNIEWGQTKGKITGISKPDKFTPQKIYGENYTYLWLPKIKIKGDKSILNIKIPLKKQGDMHINIQGVTKNGQFISYKNVIK